MATYDRFWDLHVAGPGGWYDFAGSIAEQERYQCARHEHSLPESVNLILPHHPTVPTRIDSTSLFVNQLPARGYVTSAATVDEINRGAVDDDVRQIVRWLCAPGHRGKLRINSHGDGAGNLGMASSDTGAVTWFHAGAIPHWLSANGLPEGGLSGTPRAEGLVTVAVAACMAARSSSAPATVDNSGTNSTSAPGSAVARIVDAFRDLRALGIEVTGSNEITIMGGRTQFTYREGSGTALSTGGRLQRSLGVGPKQIPEGGAWRDIDNKPYARISVPQGWKVRAHLPGTFAISIPVQYAIRAGGKNPSQNPSSGWEIDTPLGVVEVPPGWMVRKAERIIVTPLGWTFEPSSGMREGWICHQGIQGGALEERVAHSPFKVRQLT